MFKLEIFKMTVQHPLAYAYFEREKLPTDFFGVYSNRFKKNHTKLKLRRLY